MVADIAAGHVDAADLLFLVAVILFAVAGVLCITARSVPAAVGYIGLAFVALGLLVL